MSEQLILNLPHLVSQDAEDFLVSASNQAAVDVVERWPHWPAPAIVICGPSGVGKSHLVNMWQQRSHAEVVHAAKLDETLAGQLEPGHPLAIEDLHNGVASEKAMFYRLNMAREHNGALLITSQSPPGKLNIALPDLRSRLRALPVAVIALPDDTLLQGLLVKLFQDRQLRVDPQTIRSIMTHMERSAEAASKVVAEIDRLALATRRKVTRNLAKEVIHKLFPES